MARAKRLNAEKVTISIDSDVLLFAKHTALDLKMTLSDYIQSLVKEQQPTADQREPEKNRVENSTVKKVAAEKSATKKIEKPSVIEEKDLGIPMFKDDDKPAPESNTEPLDTIQIDADTRIMQLKNEGITNRQIAETLNNEGIKTLKGLQWNLENIKKRLQVIRGNGAGQE